MFRVGLYARVSTQDQQTIPLQMRAMREYAATRGWTIVMQVKEVGSGASERELRQKLIDAARRREIDIVLVWRLDRWGRSLPDLVTTLEELNHLGVGFVSLTEALDLTTPTGRAMAGLLSVFAAFEHEILRERVRAGLAHARQNGKRLGRPATAAIKSAEIRKAPSRRRQQSRDRSEAEHRPHLGPPHSHFRAYSVIVPRTRTVYQIKITLQDIQPPVWRRIQVWEDITLAQLHTVLQIVMDWEDYHLHQFSIGKRIYSVPDPEDDLYERTVIDESRERLSDVVPRVGTTFTYLYDFGDNWRHDLLLEAIMMSEHRDTLPTVHRRRASNTTGRCWRRLRVREVSGGIERSQ